MSKIKCTQCGILKEQNEDNFPKSSFKADGKFAPACKECKAKKSKELSNKRKLEKEKYGFF